MISRICETIFSLLVVFKLIGLTEISWMAIFVPFLVELLIVSVAADLKNKK